MKKRLLALALASIVCVNFGSLSDFRYHLHSIGYGINHFGRQVGRDIEWLTRSKEKFFFETSFRVYSALIHTPLFISTLPLQVFFYSMAATLPLPPLEIVDEGSIGSSKPLFIVSLNTCFHDGFIAPYSGGVSPPFEPLENGSNRVEAIAEWVGKQGPDLFLGQEFHDFQATNYFLSELKKYGYTFFIVDASSHPLFANSGLFVASKRKLGDVSFLPFSFSDRAGDDRAATRGVALFSVLDEEGKPTLRILHTHLNSGSDNQATRKQQIEKYVIPHFANDEITLLIGDLNFNTTDNETGLEKYQNVFAGEITYSDEGKCPLRGHCEPPIYEKIDAIVINTDRVQIRERRVEQLKIGNDLLSDHFAITAIYGKTDP